MGKKTVTDRTLSWISELTATEGRAGSGEVHLAKISASGSRTVNNMKKYKNKTQEYSDTFQVYSSTFQQLVAILINKKLDFLVKCQIHAKYAN